VGERSSATIELWMSFIAVPTARSWYRAHNASIVSAYLEKRPLVDPWFRADRRARALRLGPAPASDASLETGAGVFPSPRTQGRYLGPLIRPLGQPGRSA
jgi:hypothetical protein